MLELGNPYFHFIHLSFLGLLLALLLPRSILNKCFNCFQVLKDGLSTVHVPYSYGFAIILLTVLVKAATFPLTKKQVSFRFHII